MTRRLEANGHGLHTMLGQFSILALMYLGATGSKKREGGGLQAVVFRSVLLTFVMGGGGRGGPMCG